MIARECRGAARGRVSRGYLQQRLLRPTGVRESPVQRALRKSPAGKSMRASCGSGRARLGGGAGSVRLRGLLKKGTQKWSVGDCPEAVRMVPVLPELRIAARFRQRAGVG